MAIKTLKKIEDFIKFNTLKRYINEEMQMRSSEEAIRMTIDTIDELVKKLLNQAQTNAKEQKRNTIMEEDMQIVLEQITKKELSWEETAEEIIKKNPTDLGKISKKINEHIQTKI